MSVLQAKELKASKVYLQHALGPDRTFHPFPLTSLGSSRLSSPPTRRHSRRFPFIRSGHSTSTFLHPLAPSRFRNFPATMGALTAARLVHLHQPTAEQLSLVHMARPSTHSATKHPPSPVIASCCPPSVTGLLRVTPMGSPWLPSGLDFTMNPLAHRYVRPNRVRYPADYVFASGCSPPHLAVTQLPSTIGSGHLPKEDFHLLDRACSQAHGFPFSRESGVWTFE